MKWLDLNPIFCFDSQNTALVCWIYDKIYNVAKEKNKNRKEVFVWPPQCSESLLIKKKVLQKWSLTVGVCRECVEGEREEEKQNDDDDDEDE